MNVYSIFKVGFLTILMVSIGVAEAFCISIDRYKTSNGRNIYLFGDMHMSSREQSQQDEEAFIAAAKKKGAVCIVEDVLSYEGDNQNIQRSIDDVCYENIFQEGDQEEIRYPESSLFGLARKCLANGIPCFNAECRYALNIQLKQIRNDMDVLLTMISEELDNIVEEEKSYNDEVLTNHYQKVLSEFVPYKGIDSEITWKVSKKSFGEMFLKDSFSLFDVRILHQVYELLKDEHDKRDIFIFAGANHINNIAPALVECLGCEMSGKKKLECACKLEMSKKFPAPDHVDGNYLIWEKQVAQKFIDKIKVDITQFFKQERKRDIAFRLRKMRRRLNQEKKNKYKKLTAVAVAATIV